jgi:hypothetical protein
LVLVDKIKGTPPEPRAFHSSYLISNRFLVITGGVSQQQEVLSDLVLFDFKFGEYSSIDVEDNVKSSKIFYK